MTKLHSSLGPNPRLVRMFLVEKGLKEGQDFERVHYDIIAGENRQSADIFRFCLTVIDEKIGVHRADLSVADAGAF